MNLWLLPSKADAIFTKSRKVEVGMAGSDGNWDTTCSDPACNLVRGVWKSSGLSLKDASLSPPCLLPAASGIHVPGDVMEGAGRV